MVPWLVTLVALTEDQGSDPSTHSGESQLSLDSSSRGSNTPFLASLWTAGTHKAHIHTCRGKAHSLKIELGCWVMAMSNGYMR